MLSRRIFIQTLIASTIASGVSAQSRNVSSQSKAALSSLLVSQSSAQPNIILFLVDDMGWQDTSVPFYYKDGVAQVTTLNKRYDTPNMQRLADQGMLFTNAYSQSVCTPTRASILSGMNSARSRITNWTGGFNAPTNAVATSEGVRVPKWSANGLQPVGTLPTGRTVPPYWAKNATDQQKKEGLPYTLKHPYACAKTLPMFLKDAGYTTIHCGKAHFGVSSYNRVNGNGTSSPGANPILLGFDHNIAGCEIGGPANYRGKTRYGNPPFNGSGYDIPGLDGDDWYNEKNDVFLTDALTAAALKRVDDVRSKAPVSPFFLYMSHYAIHVPITNATAWDRTRSSSTTLASDTMNPNPRDGLPWNEYERNYTTLIKGMDDSLGSILDYLEANNLDKNTVVLFTSDNGGLTRIGGQRMHNACAPLKEGKGSCYEGGTRVPLIASWSGKIAPASRCDVPVICEDLFSTCLNLAGLDVNQLQGLATTTNFVQEGFDDIPQVIDGVSFVPLLRGEAPLTPRPLIFHYPNTWIGTGGTNTVLSGLYNLYTALRYDKWKLIYQHGTQVLELYDLDVDIGEATNLASQQPAKLLELATIMGQQLRNMNAVMPTYVAGNVLGIAAGTPVPYPENSRSIVGGI